MPELAEVEFMARRLDAWLKGAPMTVNVIDPKLDPTGALASAPAERVQRVHRRAKYAVVEGENHRWVLHFRMTGKVVRWGGAADEMPRHTRAILHTEDAHVAFVDMRRFGTFELVPSVQWATWEASKRLGDEPWPERRPASWWRERLGSLKTPIKKALMAQDRVVGLGNILASEVLFQARVSPRRPANTLGDEEWDAVSRALHETVGAVLEMQVGDEIAYVNEGASPEAAGFRVYGRAGEPAECCGGPIERIVESGRSTFWCPNCQR